MRRAVFTGAVLLALTLAVALPRAQQAGGGAAAPLKFSNGTLTPIPIDPARPWGWATRNFMENPNRKLYNKAKAKLLAGQQVFSHTISSLDPKRHCEEAPHYDFTWFEMQHSRMRFDEVEQMIRACPGVGATPIVRVPDAVEGNIQKAFDLGALGVIVPNVDDSDKARDAGRFSRVGPVGRRSLGGNALWNSFMNPGETYQDSTNDNTLVILMVERPAGIAEAFEIASMPGIDVVITGNGDLTRYIGFPETDSHYEDYLIQLRDAVYRAGKFWGNSHFTFATGNRLSADSRLHQNGPSNDGWVPPPARGAAAPAGGAAPAAAPPTRGGAAPPATPPARGR